MNPFGTLGMISFPGTNGYSRNMWDTEYNDFQPRVGAAYQITNSLVARGGFGITYLPSNTGYFSSPNDYGEASFAPGNKHCLMAPTPVAFLRRSLPMQPPWLRRSERIPRLRRTTASTRRTSTGI